MEINSLLFVGRRNAARSIMAETCFNAAGFTGWRAFSAGWQTQHRVDRLAISVLASQGFETDSLSSKPVAIFRQAGAPAIHRCIFLDDLLPPDVEDYPGPREYWRIEDPSAAADRRAAYEAALAEVCERVGELVLSGRLIPRSPPLARAG